jgi:hypothetical protein
MIVDIRFDTQKLSNEQIEQINLLVPFAEWSKHVQEKPKYSHHMRDMTKGWEKIGNIRDYRETMGPFIPGTYALVYDPKGNIDNPITWNQTLSYGETTQAAHKRIYQHSGALRGLVTNMTEKWNKTIPRLNKIIGSDIRNNLRHISIFFRPHNVTDSDFQFDREHSCNMEKQAHAHYYAIWGHGTMFNTRDLPNNYMIENAKSFLESKGIPCKYLGNVL